MSYIHFFGSALTVPEGAYNTRWRSSEPELLLHIHVKIDLYPKKIQLKQELENL